jgi:serine phosphatase RsbU (regulator of sigma subunit)
MSPARHRRRGEQQLMLDLAAHLKAISAPPDCTDAWRVQTALAVADGAPIGGDFMVFARDEDGSRLQAVIVDSSGKGAEAATRAVMLAGALSGLLGEVPSGHLLPAVNRHILRMDWDEHFATAVHLDLDLGTGDYRIGVAGHPAPAHYDAGSGRWQPLPATGPALGFFSAASWAQHHRTLAPGDALLVVTDGVVETPGQDLDTGLDRMLGQAERLVLTDFAGGAERLLAQRRHIGQDDAQVLLLCRAAACGADPARSSGAGQQLAGLRRSGLIGPLAGQRTPPPSRVTEPS